MDAFVWDQNFITGVEDVDVQHHALVEYTLSPEAEAGALRCAAFLIRYYGQGGQLGQRRLLPAIARLDVLFHQIVDGHQVARALAIALQAVHAQVPRRVITQLHAQVAGRLVQIYRHPLQPPLIDARGHALAQRSKAITHAWLKRQSELLLTGSARRQALDNC